MAVLALQQQRDRDRISVTKLVEQRRGRNAKLPRYHRVYLNPFQSQNIATTDWISFKLQRNKPICCKPRKTKKQNNSAKTKNTETKQPARKNTWRKQSCCSWKNRGKNERTKRNKEVKMAGKSAGLRPYHVEVFDCDNIWWVDCMWSWGVSQIDCQSILNIIFILLH